MKPFDPNIRKTLEGKLTAQNQHEFETQFANILLSAKEPKGLVYVMNSCKPIPRLRGSSTVIYIGKTKQSLFGRYPKWNIHADTVTFWKRYIHILTHYGAITIDIYPTLNPEVSENDFLFAYHQEYLEAPPFNTINFRVSQLNDIQRSELRD